MKKSILLSILSCLFCVAAIAQTQSLGIDYFRTGESQIAKQIFTNELASNPAQSNYYLGEIAFAEGNLEQAKDFYSKALSASADFSLANVGLGKYYLKKGDPKAAEDAFSTALKKNKKDVEVLVAIAEAYFLNGQEDKANAKIDEAIKANKKSPLPYVLQGDILTAKNQPGDAAGKYDMAIYFDPNYTVAYLKSAQVYEAINPESAIEKLNKVLEINPNYMLAYRDLGRIYTNTGFYPKAIENYKRFFDGKTYSVADITKYASALYFNKQYDEAIALLKEGLAKDPDNFVLNRLYMYTLADSKKYQDALPVAQKFFSLQAKKTDKIYQDYKSYGDILMNNNQAQAAVEEYKAAIALDSTKVSLFKDIATSFADNNQFGEAADFYSNYIAKSDTTLLESLDFFTLGRYYYYAANVLQKANAGTAATDSSKAQIKSLLAKADDAFRVLAERKPDSYLGFLWRARTNATLDPETTEGLAKPYYLQLIQVITSKDDKGAANPNELIEAYRYMAYYYYLKEDKANSIEYCNKLLALDPNNAVAKQLLGVLK
ncbi:MAG: tetratricopeptide repeat protein [Dysgonamonadaceae bacterium]